MNAGRPFTDSRFRAWESNAFGFGYGTGEEHILAALKGFFDAVPVEPYRGYDYRDLEKALTPTIAWLMICALCRVNIIEYGTSPRCGWLTHKGSALKAYVDARSVDVLCEVLFVDEDVRMEDDDDDH